MSGFSDRRCRLSVIAHSNALDPHRIDGWDDQRIVSSEFMGQLLDEPYVTVLDRHGVRMNGAWFRDILELQRVDTSFPVRCQNCRLAGLRADDALIGGSLDLRRSVIEGDILLDGADIGGDLEMTDAHVETGTVRGHGLSVGGAAFLDGSRLADVSLIGANIGTQFAVDRGATLSGTLNAGSLTVGHSVYLGNGSKFADVRLIGAEIGGDLSVSKASVVSGILDAQRLTVAGAIFMNGSKFVDVSLVSAHVGGAIFLHGATWRPDGLLDLRNAQVGALSSDEHVDSWPALIALSGLAYDRWSSPDPNVVGSRWFTDAWLARLEEFSPEPYDQLAEVMDAAGHPTIASDIRYSREDIERLEPPWTSPQRWGRELYGVVLGYGLRPWLAVRWFAIVWLLGLVVLWVPGRLPATTSRRRCVRRERRGVAAARQAVPVTVRSGSSGHGVSDRLSPDRRLPIVPVPRPARAPRWRAGQAAIYSLDRLLPAVKLADLEAFPALTSRQRTLMWGQQLVGWALTLFIVGWLGGLLA